MDYRDDESGRVDWLDLGPDPDEGKPPPDPRRRYLWYGGTAAVVVLALVLTRAQHGVNRAASSPGTPSHSASPSSPIPSASSMDPAVSASSVDSTVSVNPAASPSDSGFPGAPVGVSRAGHRLLDVPADWELFGYGSGTVVRIQLALGRVTSTTVPAAGSSVSVTFFVGADRAMVHPLDDTPASVVRDGKPAAELPPAFRKGSLLLPGPDQRQVWAETDNGLALLTLDGRPTGATVALPFYASTLGSDSAGYVLVSGVGGTYDARPGAVHRVTGGVLLASGPTRWLTMECDESLSCAVVVTERANGARHTLDTALDPRSGAFQGSLNTISPDGRTVALAPPGDVSDFGIHLLDLDSGVDRPVEVTPNGEQSGPAFVWSPDSHWLFVIDGAGRVMIINRATGRATPIGVQLPSMSQLAFRHRTG